MQIRRFAFGWRALIALLLLPAAAAYAEVDTHIVFEGEGAGWVKGASDIEDGVPPIECHWNGTEIDRGTGINPGTGEGESGTPAQAGHCETEAEGSGGGVFGIGVIEEADHGAKFAGWEVSEGFPFIGCSASSPSCTVLFPPITIKAKFVLAVPLTINRVGSGSGRVDCVVNGGERNDSPCEEAYVPGTVLELIAVEGANSEFAGFENGTGDAAGCTTSPCGPVTLEEESEVDARFELIPHTLTVEASGEGSVDALEPPEPLSGEIADCEEAAGSCSAQYGEGQTVTLQAAPGAEKSVRWSGCDDVPSADECEVTVEANTTVEAEFIAGVLAVQSEPPTANSGTRATLAGTVSPQGLEVDECFFEWGENVVGPPVYGNVEPCAEYESPLDSGEWKQLEDPGELGAGANPVPVRADISGLVPQGGRYEYRLVAVNANATAAGDNQIFVTPDTVFAEAASGITATEAALNGAVDPDTAVISDCAFEWGPQKEPFEEEQQFPEEAPCVPGPGAIAGEGPVPVEAHIAGLDPGSVYAYRLKATYPTGPVLSSSSSLQTLGPAIAGTWSEDVTRSEATLKAAVNPAGKATTYRFEWGTTEAYGSQTAELAVGSDSQEHELTRHLSGLIPGASYHFRVVATNPDAEHFGPDIVLTTYERPAPDLDCPNQDRRYGPSGKLPDCRAYEMVSPVDKAGQGIEVEVNNGGGAEAIRQAAPDGGKLTYSSKYAFGDSLSAKFVNQYIATRTPSGWSTHGINAPQGTTIFDPEYDSRELGRYFRAFTPDLSSAWLRDYNQMPLAPGGREGFPNFYRRDNLVGAYEAISTAAPSAGSGRYEFEIRGFTADGSHVFLNVERPLTADAAASTNYQIYEHSGGELKLISVLPGGGADPEWSFVGDAEAGETPNLVHNAVSADGSRVFWSSASSRGAGAGRIFVRVEGSRTVPVSEAVSDETAQFWGATADGSKVLFSIEATFGTFPPRDGNLYEFDVDEALASSDPQAPHPEAVTQIAGEVEGVAAAAEDFSRIYFVSREALAPGAVAGEENLYVRGGGGIELVATSGGDATTRSSPVQHTATATPDGSHLLFESDRELTGYDSAARDSGVPVKQVYLYGAEEGRLRCVSCNPSGARASSGAGKETVGGGSLLQGSPSEAAAWIPTSEDALHALRPLSADGDRVFFNSFDALVPEDTNGAQDVYEWEAPGAGSCEAGDPEYSELNGGCLYLISTGVSPEPSEFVEASFDGSSVFIETESSLNPEDPDLNDIYVARVGGGFPPPAAPIPCVGDACQSIPPVPDDPTPASAGFRGAGNPTPGRRCGAVERLSRSAKHARRRAQRLRRQAAKASGARSVRIRRAQRRAERLSKRAKRCLRANRRARR